MSTVNHTILKNELYRDPLEIGYKSLSFDEIAAMLNVKQFSEAALFSDTQAAQIFYVTAKMQQIALGIHAQQVKRSRAELLFGNDVVVTAEDVRLSYLS